MTLEEAKAMRASADECGCDGCYADLKQAVLDFIAWGQCDPLLAVELAKEATR